MRITLYELFELCSIDSCDIADETYDFVTNITAKHKVGSCRDYYDKLMRFFSTRIECCNYDTKDNIAHCFITEFIKKNIKIFDEFMLKHNKEEFQPSPLIEDDSEVWYDVYMNTFENLLVGNYSDDDYKELYKAFGGK